VQTALNRWLAGQITVQNVNVLSLDETPDPAQLLIQIEYTLIETQSNKQTQVRIL